MSTVSHSHQLEDTQTKHFELETATPFLEVTRTREDGRNSDTGDGVFVRCWLPLGAAFS